MPEPTIKELVKAAYQNAKDKGFHDEDDMVTVAHRLMLIVGEVNEGFEELRSGHDLTENYFTYSATHNGVKFKNLSVEQYTALTGTDPTDDGLVGKPEGIPSELADVVIRIFDFAGVYGIDLQRAILNKMDFNSGREFKHGRAF